MPTAIRMNSAQYNIVGWFSEWNQNDLIYSDVLILKHSAGLPDGVNVMWVYNHYDETVTELTYSGHQDDNVIYKRSKSAEEPDYVPMINQSESPGRGDVIDLSIRF